MQATILNDISCAVELLTQLNTELMMDRPPLSARWRYFSSKILVFNLKWPIFFVFVILDIGEQHPD